MGPMFAIAGEHFRSPPTLPDAGVPGPYDYAMQNNSPKNKMTIKQSTFIFGLSIGISLGVAIGVATDNMGVGIGCGIAFGAAIIFSQSQSK
jgi:hypothetical protein